MGRKIPGKKHRGVKDPEKQHLKRLNSLKGKINAPPVDPDYQEIPNSLTRIAQLKDGLKDRIKSKREKRNSPSNDSQSKGKQKKPKQFQRYKGESDKHFLFRVQKACVAVIKEKCFEDKYGVEIKRNPQTGEVEKLVKRPKDVLEKYMEEAQQNSKNQKSKRKKKSEPEKPVLTKSQKRQKKLKEKKLQRNLKAGEPETVQEVIRFGEVVHEPPNLTVPKKGAKHDVSRPGQRNLLLKSVMNAKAVDETNSQTLKKKGDLKKPIDKLDKSGKRKNLPVALRRRLEKQQTEVINAYRELKKQKKVSV